MRNDLGLAHLCHVMQLIDNSSEQVLRLQLVMVEKLLSGILPGLAAELQLILYQISTSWHEGKIERREMNCRIRAGREGCGA